MTLSREQRAYVQLILVTIIWASLLPTSKLALRGVPPLTIAAIRMGLGSLFLFLYARRDPRHHVPWNPRLVGTFVLLGFLGYFVSVGCAYYGLRQTTVTNAALLNAASPATIALLSAALLKEWLPLQTFTGILLSMVGVGIIITRGSWEIITESRYNPGDLVMLGAIISWGVYTIYSRRLMERMSPLAVTTYSYISGAVLLVIVSSLTEWQTWTSANTPAASWAAIAYQAVMGTLAHFWFSEAVAVVGPSHAGVFLNLVPVMAISIAVFFLGEPLTLPHLVGGAIVIGGIVVAARR